MRALPFLFALVLAGCARQTSVAGAAPPPNWKMFTAGEFTMAIPGEWTPFDLSKQDLTEIFKQVELPVNSGDIKEKLQAMVQQGTFRLFAFAPVMDARGFRNNVNVNVTKGSGSMSSLEKALRSQYEQIGATDIETSVERNPDYVTVGGSITMKVAGDSVSYRTFAAGFPVSGQLYMVTFSCTPAERESMQALARQAFKTVSVK